MKRILVLKWSITIILLYFVLTSFVMAEGIGMVTGSKTGTYIKFGQQIAEKARTVGVNIIVKESEGSIANIERLRSTENAAFAIVQSDVLGFLKRSSLPEMRRTAEKLRLIFPFYNEEVHLFANKKIKRFEDLQGKRVVLGTEGSGNWLTSTNLLKLLNVVPAEIIALSPSDAVISVLLGEVDAMFYVAGKPVKIFKNLNEVSQDITELLKSVHIVPLNDPKMLKEYVSSEITPAEYTWLDADVPTIAVKAVLITYDFSRKQSPYYRMRCQQLRKLGQVIRDNIEELRRTGHPKWREVDLKKNLGIWELDACSRSRGSQVSPPASKRQRLRDLIKKELQI